MFTEMIMYFVFGYSDKIFLFMDTTNFSKLFSTFAACSRNQLTKQLQKIELQRKKMNNRKETNKKKKSRGTSEKKSEEQKLSRQLKAKVLVTLC